ncbi:MAG: deaminase, partial [Magnetococcus sp. YQC-3]
RLGTVIFKNSKIISVGHNNGNRYRNNLNPKYTRWAGSLHAEVAAILNAREPLANMEMLVIRLGSKGEFRIAKPCEYCFNYIKNINLKRVIYSIDDNTFGVIERKNFNNNDDIIEIGNFR